MQALDLDFARPAGPSRRAAAALALAGTVALGAVLAHAATLDAEARALAAARDDAQRSGRHDRRPLKAGAEGEALARDIARASAVIASLNVDWSALFRHIEAAHDPAVTLLALQPEAGQARRIRLAGQARRLDDVLDYVQRLSASPGLVNVHLVQHESVDDGARRGVQFALLVDWIEPQQP